MTPVRKTLDNLAVVLVKPRFPENVGMVARACANMGCGRLILINPELWLPEKALPLATRQGQALLDNLEICDDLGKVLEPFNLACATSARLGGWRKEFYTPEKAGEIIAARLEDGGKAAIVFGPEDKGLANSEISLAHFIVNIPTADDATSLNLAQSVLVVLYECFKALTAKHGRSRSFSTRIKLEEQFRLEETLKTELLRLDCLHGENPEYFFAQWRQLLRRAGLRRNEYDALMGLCRQLKQMSRSSC